MIYISLLILFATLLLGVPVPVSFMASSLWLVFFGGVGGAGHPFSQLIPFGYSQMASVPLIAILLFIMAGGLMERGKIGEKIINLVEVFLGRIKGGLGVVGVVSCGLFGSVVGAAVATLSCIGPIMFKRLEQAGYPKGYSSALMANAALLGLLLPPNATLIIFAWISNVSVLAAFLSTVSAGILMIFLLSLTNIWMLRDNKTIVVAEKRTSAEKWSLFKHHGLIAIPALLLPFIILGSIYGGIMTPTEASAIAVVYAIPVGMFVYRSLTLRDIWECLIESGVTTGVIMAMLFSVSMLGRLYLLEDLPGTAMVFFTSVSENRWVIMGMINIFLIVLGTVMDDISVIVLTTPILMPVIQELGFNPVHFAAIVGVNTALGCIMPPCAPVLYLSGRLSNTPIDQIIRPTLWFILLCWVPVLIIVTYFPSFALFLPHVVLGVPW